MNAATMWAPPELPGITFEATLAQYAVHEAAHAIVGIVLGESVAYVNVLPTLARDGCAVFTRPFGQWSIDTFVLMALAGGIAERRIDPLARNNRTDMRNVCALLSVHRIPGERYDEAAIDRTLAKREREAAKLVDQHWLWIERTAFELTLWRRLSGDEIAALRRGWI